MSDELEPKGMKRREFIRRTAITGATVAWAAPVIQTIGMGRAAAQSTTPCDPEISYIGINLRCSDGTLRCIWVKYEIQDGEYVCVEGSGTVEAQCGLDPCEDGFPDACDQVSVTGTTFQATIQVTDPNCELLQVAVFGGNCCDVFGDGTNPIGTSLTVSCPTNC